jgi:hypothetical protein
VTENNTPGVNDEELLRRAVQCGRLSQGSKNGSLRWNVIMGRFALGSTYARALCIRFGFDPNEEVRR